MTQGKYLSLQGTFFKKLRASCVKGQVTLQVPKITPISNYDSFLGEDDRDYTDTEYKLECVYTRSISDETRAKYGISRDIDTIVYISPLELERVTTSQVFDTNLLRRKERLRALFLGVEYDISQMIELEPMDFGGKRRVLAHEIRLKKIAGARG